MLAGRISLAVRRDVFTKTFDENVLPYLVEVYNDRIRFSPGAEPYITLRIKNESGKIILEEVKKFLNNLI